MNKKYLFGSIAGIVVIGALAVFFLGQKPAEPNSKLRVVTSFYPVWFLASEIGGEHAEVINVTPAGAEPHDYEPTPSQIRALYDSSLFIMNGAGLEAWGERIASELPETVLVIEAGEGLATLSGEIGEEVSHDGEGDEHGLYDPHVWLSPVLASRMVDTILAGFVKTDPDHAPQYESRAVILKQELGALAEEFRSGLSQCAKDDFITSHAAFGYIAHDYNLHQLSIAGLSPEAEPSAKTLAEISVFARENNVEYIFFETLVSPKLAETIAREAGAGTLVLNPIEGLTPEELTAGKTYLSEMRNNLANLKVALSCR